MLDPSCDSAFISQTIESLSGWCGRDFEVLSDVIVDKYLYNHDSLKHIIVDRQHIISAIKAVNKDKAIRKNRKKIVTDFEQRENHHQDSIQLQKQLHQESLAHQKDMTKKSIQTNIELQCRQKNPVTGNVQLGGSCIPVSASVTWSRSPGVTKEAAQEIMDNVFPEEEAKKEEVGVFAKLMFALIECKEVMDNLFPEKEKKEEEHVLARWIVDYMCDNS
jgi:hypothetical protein